MKLETSYGAFLGEIVDVQVGGGGSSMFKFQFLVNYECKFVARYLKKFN